MRILFLTQVFPYPPDSGPKIKTYHVMRYLANAGHAITLASFVRAEQEREHLAALQPYSSGGIHTVLLQRSRLGDARHLAQSLFSNTPFLIARDYVPAMADLVRSLVTDAIKQGQPYDAIHADQLNMAQYALLAKSAISNCPLFTGHCSLPTLILDEHNAVWTILDRSRRLEASWTKTIYFEFEARKLKAYEGRVCREFDTVLAVSENDRKGLKQAMQGWRRIPVIPIGVDSTAVQPLPHQVDANAILSIGTMSYPPNVDGVLWFAKQVFPLIQREIPQATFTIIGARPPCDVMQLAVRNSAISVTGYVSDLTPYLSRAACLIVPLRSASGMRVKILEAWARGIPVVSTTVGCEGLAAVPGEHLLVGDTPRDLAAAVLHLLRDPDLRQRLAEAGRRLVEEEYDWRVACKGLDAIYPREGIATDEIVPTITPSRSSVTDRADADRPCASVAATFSRPAVRRRVLLLTQVLPYPPNAGPKINVFHKLRHLAEQNAITLVSYIRSEQELDYLDALSPYCEAIYTVPIHRSLLRDGLAYLHSVVRNEPFLITRDDSSAMRHLVNQLLRARQYDLIHIDQINMFQFVRAVGNMPRLLDEHNATWMLVERLYQVELPGLRKLALNLEVRKMRRYEGRVCRMCNSVLVLSEQDRRALMQVISGTLPPIEIVPLAWDCSGERLVQRQPDAKGVLSVGTMFYPPNVDGVLWFAKEVWPEIGARVPDATFWVIGARPPDEVTALSQDGNGIKVIGYVEDVTPYIRQSALMVVPLRSGGGMRWKILEAFVKGIPVVSTTVGAEGFNVVNGRELLLADTPKDFADAVVRLLQDQALGNELAARARRFAEITYNPPSVYARLDAMYERLAPLPERMKQ
jgi:glycosyltransferase involved in cell wall biosynthesis